jgi:hypothetical protein
VLSAFAGVYVLAVATEGYLFSLCFSWSACVVLPRRCSFYARIRTDVVGWRFSEEFSCFRNGVR